MVPISLQASDLLAPCTRHGQNQLRHLFGLIQWDELVATRDEEEFGPREGLLARRGDTAVQGSIGVAKDDPNRTPEFFHLRDHLVARADHGHKSTFRRKKAGWT